MIEVQLRTVAGLNVRENWRVRARRVKKERETIAWALSRTPKPQVPLTVRLTRVAPSAGLDDDNLPGSLKGVRDEIAKWLGVDDRHRMQVRYVYAQTRAARGHWAVRIEWLPPVAGAQLSIDSAADPETDTQYAAGTRSRTEQQATIAGAA